jgi:hypothetical protein
MLQFLIALIVLCGAVGFGLGNYGANWWALAVFTLLAIVSLHASYIAGSMLAFLG